MTLIINASTAGWLIKKLGIIKKELAKEQIFKHFLVDLLNECLDKINELKQNDYLSLCDWEQVEKLTGTEFFNKKIKEIEDKIKLTNSKEIKEQKSNELSADMIEVSNKNQVDSMKITPNPSSKIIEPLIRESETNEIELTKEEERLVIEARSRFLISLKVLKNIRIEYNIKIKFSFYLVQV